MRNDEASVMKLQFHDTNGSSNHRYIELEIESHGIAIRPIGYGDKLNSNGKGSPVFIEFRNGIPMVLVWDDINNEEPSHIISLEKASESNRGE
jgi:hypothetical protein